MTLDSAEPKVVALVSDLMFQSKITAAARRSGVAVRFCRSGSEFATAVSREKPVLALVDLHVAAEGVGELVDCVRSGGDARIVGFASHVDRDVLDQAVQAGMDEAMPRSQFEHRLEPLLVSARGGSPE